MSAELAAFTDEQIADELKARGWSEQAIEDHVSKLDTCPSWCVECPDVGEADQGLRLHQSSVRTTWVRNRFVVPPTQIRLALQRSMLDGEEPTIYIGCIWEGDSVPSDLLLLDADAAASFGRELIALAEL